MSDTTFVPGTVIASTWLNDVNDTTYLALGTGGLAPTTPAAVRANLGFTASTGSSLSGHIASGTGAVATTTQAKLREHVSDVDFGAVGNGTTDDLIPLTNFFNSAIANPGIPHSLRARTYAVSASLPTINVSDVIIIGCGAAIHDVGSLFSGTVIKWIGAAGSTMQTISSVSGATNQKISNIQFLGVGFDCNNLAANGLVVKSIKESKIDVAIANATAIGLTLDVVALLGEARDLQKNEIKFVGRQIEAPAGLSLFVTGDATANVSMNWIYADIQHKNGTAIIEANADNNDWIFIRTLRVAGGTATEAISWQGGATEPQSCREERIHFLTSNVQSQSYGTASFTVGAANIRIFCLDIGNGTPVPAVQVGSSVYWNNSTRPFGDTPWVTYTPAITAAVGTFTTVSATGRFLQRGKICHVQMTITITTNGTAATAILATLPFLEASGKSWIFSGKETSVTGSMQQGIVAGGGGQISITDYAGLFSGGNGRSITINGFYEIA